MYEPLSLVVTIESHHDGVSETALARFLARARGAAKLSGEVHVLLVSNARMRSLNSKFRGKKQPTDVLSFPALPEIAREFAGDIVISGPIAAANARRFGHSVSDELKVLILHGVLHLGGHDHEGDDGEMARREQRLRKQLGLRDGLIERTQTQHSRRRRG